MTPWDAALNSDAVLNGFTLVYAASFVVWGLSVGLAIVRRLLSA